MSTLFRNRYGNWPWPTVLPFAKEKWFPSLKTNASISQDVRRVQGAGDMAVVALLLVVGYRFYSNYSTGAYQGLRYYTNGMPPALIANDFNFEDLSRNRTVTRAQLDRYREKVAAQKEPLEDFIFKV